MNDMRKLLNIVESVQSVPGAGLWNAKTSPTVVPPDPAIEQIKNRAREESKGGYGVHVNKDKETGRVYISDWYDSDETIASYANGREMNTYNDRLEMVDTAMEAITGSAGEITDQQVRDAYAKRHEAFAKDLPNKYQLADYAASLALRYEQQKSEREHGRGFDPISGDLLPESEGTLLDWQKDAIATLFVKNLRTRSSKDVAIQDTIDSLFAGGVISHKTIQLARDFMEEFIEDETLPDDNRYNDDSSSENRMLGIFEDGDTAEYEKRLQQLLADKRDRLKSGMEFDQAERLYSDGYRKLIQDMPKAHNEYVRSQNDRFWSNNNWQRDDRSARSAVNEGSTFSMGKIMENVDNEAVDRVINDLRTMSDAFIEEYDAREIAMYRLEARGYSDKEIEAIMKAVEAKLGNRTSVTETSSPTVHTFDSTGQAYDATQIGEWFVDDEAAGYPTVKVKNGDILVIPSEGVVGLCSTWPVAVTKNPGKLHSMKPEFSTPEDIAEVTKLPLAAVQAAFQKAQELGFETVNKNTNETEIMQEAYDLQNGYNDVEHAEGIDYFPDGADGPVTDEVGPSGARQGDNPEQKKMQVAETHKELVYAYRKFLKESK